MPPATSIWLKTQPPKMWPFVLMSPGRGTVRNMGSRPADPLVFGSIVIIHFPFQRIVNLLVMASATGKKNQAHKRCRQHHGQAYPRNGCNHHVDRRNSIPPPQHAYRDQYAQYRAQHHPPKDPTTPAPTKTA